MHKNIIPHISERLKKSLPGWDAHKIMSPLQTAKYRESPADAKQASVGLLLYPDSNEELQVLYIKRTNFHPDDKHGGQISFPGGQQEEKDLDPEDTALREVTEEIGIPRQQISILGELSPIFVYVSRFYVRTFVGYVGQKPDLILQATEVDKVIHVPLKYLISGEAQKNKDFTIRDHAFKNMPYYDLEGEVLWGATAMITSEFVELVKSSGA